MTIKVRNRLNLLFFIFSIILMFVDLGFIGYQHIHTEFRLPEVYFSKAPSTNPVFGYNSYAVILSIILELLYSVVFLFLINRNFIKTQSTIVLFFLIFLEGCVFDSVRILIPIFHISGTFSQALLMIGNISLFGRLLSPAALLFISILTLDEQPVNSDRNLLLLLIFSLFIAVIIPINTAKILPTFNVSYSYSKVVLALTTIIELISVFTVLINNIRNDNSQVPTIGFFLMTLGYALFIYSTSYFMVGLTFAILCVGSGIYIYKLHDSYLWR